MNLIGLLQFHIAFSEILLTACAGQLLYIKLCYINYVILIMLLCKLIKLCFTCPKQNTSVNASDACSLLAK